MIRANRWLLPLVLAVLVPAAVLGLLTIALAVTAHEAAEIIAVLNGLRARSRGAGSSSVRAQAPIPPTS